MKPLTGMRLRLSAPPTMATSTSPASIRRRPLMIARALEEQAVEMVYAGPSSASQLARKRDGSPSSCCGYCHCGLRSPFCARRTYSSPSSSPEVLVPSTTATRSRPTRAMAVSTAGRICASAASSSWLLRLRCAEKGPGTGEDHPPPRPARPRVSPVASPHAGASRGHASDQVRRYFISRVAECVDHANGRKVNHLSHPDIEW